MNLEKIILEAMADERVQDDLRIRKQARMRAARLGFDCDLFEELAAAARNDGMAPEPALLEAERILK
jgi:hypothetical protein